MPIPQLNVRSPKGWRNKKEKPVKRVSKQKAPNFEIPKKRGGESNIIKKIRVKQIGDRLINIDVLKKLFKLVIIAGIFGIFLFAGLIAYYSKDLPDPNKVIDRTIAQSTKIYDRTGENLLYEISGDQKRTVVELSEIPNYAIQATIAIEDKNFFNHGGISIWGIIRGQIVPRLQGKRAQGGSTLTQQFVKNAILTDERSIARKIKEWILSYRLEQKFTKDEILKLYFNEIPYGSNVYGIEAAANYYFGKSSKNLSLAEAAILAALPQAPSYYSPYGTNKEGLIGRQQYVLELMREQNYITNDQLEEAKNYQLDFKNRITNITAPHFVLFVKEYLANKYGDQMVEQGGLKVITTLDLDAQTKAEAAINERAERNQNDYNANNASLVAIDVPTGQILSLVGSRDFFNDDIDGQFNVATSPRQPGSSFKPFVYLTGFTKGYTPDSVLFDLNTVFKAEPENYEPKNYDLKEYGPVSIRQALAGSLNIPAVKMIYLAGVSNVLDLADEFGYTTLTDRSRYGLSLVLGGGEVKLIEHVNAFAALAREGVWIPYSFILSVEDANGRELEKYEEPDDKRVVDIEYVRMLNNVLSDNSARAYVFGENNYLTLPNRPVAAKTGTTNDYHDAWTVGYTPYQVAVGVWVGNSNNDEMKRGAAGGVVAAPIWQNFLKNYLVNKEVKQFTKTEYTNASKPMIGGYLEGGEKIKIDKFSKKLATEYTPLEAIEEKTFKQIHNILHYINKDNTLGPEPEKPQDDYQYANWEEPVRKWAEAQGIADEQAPTEFDDLHKPEDKPSIQITSPNNNFTLVSGQLLVSVSAGAPRGAEKVEYYLDDKLLKVIYTQPFDLIYNIPPSISNGKYILTAKVFDDILNNNDDNISITIEREEYIKMSWLNPSTGTTINSLDFPYTLEIGVDDIDIISQVDFYYKLDSSNQTHWFGFTKPTSLPIKINWSDKPNSGIYKVYPVFTDKQGQVVQGKDITISIED